MAKLQIIPSLQKKPPKQTKQYTEDDKILNLSIKGLTQPFISAFINVLGSKWNVEQYNPAKNHFKII